MTASEKFLGQRDNDARGAAHIAKPVLVLVLDHLTDEFGAVVRKGASPKAPEDCRTPRRYRARLTQ